MTDRRLPKVSPEREAVLIRVAALYAEGKTMREVMAVTGMTKPALRGISAQYGITSLPEARDRARGHKGGEWSASRQAIRDGYAQKLRECIAKYDCTILEAGRRLGYPPHRAHMLSKAYGLKASARAMRAAQVAGGIAGANKQRETTPAPPNPYRTPAQQAHIASMRDGAWAPRKALKYAPQPANADQLVAEALAQGRVTKCPTVCVLPVNNGDGL